MSVLADETFTDEDGRIIPGSLAHLEDNPPQRCKIDGCDNPSSGKGIPWNRLCQQHITAEVSRRQRVRHGKTGPSVPKEPVPQPPSGDASPLARDAQGGASTLLTLAQAVVDTRAAYDAAIRRLKDHVAALDAA